MDYLWILPEVGLAIGDPEEGTFHEITDDEWGEIMDELMEAHESGQIH